MFYALRFEQWQHFYWLIPLFILAIFTKKFLIKSAYYQYPLLSFLAQRKQIHAPTYKKVFFLLRIFILLLLIFLIAKPQLVDHRTKITVDGIDIILTLDVSGSMQFQDYDNDNRSRLDVAKEEALRFVKKRTNDAIGLVIFGNDALTRIPLTLDKNMINQMIQSLQLGMINPNGTVLSTALVTALNRLKTSKAKSKIIILLTDGEPTENDINANIPIELAKQLDVKIYTIGIGSDSDQLFLDPLFGLRPKPKINKMLLSKIANDTGGKFFLAGNAKDMRTIYDTIDALEKTPNQAPIYNIYYDIFIPFVWIIIVLLLLELLLSSTIWFGI